MLDKDI